MKKNKIKKKTNQLSRIQITWQDPVHQLNNERCRWGNKRQVCVQKHLYVKDGEYIDETFQYQGNGKIDVSEPLDGIDNQKNTLQRRIKNT